MITPERFTLLQVHNQELLQPECPVYVHCSRRCVERRSGLSFVQVRMVNRSERCIKSVILSARENCGDADGFCREELFLSDCNALPGAIFGEERMLSLGKCNAPSLCIIVERVIFTDGMLWRRLSGQRLQTVQEAGWSRCACAMPNPPQAEACVLCGKPLAPAEAARQDEAPSEPPDAAESFFAPAQSDAFAMPAIPSAMPAACDDVCVPLGAPQIPQERPLPIVRTEPVYYPVAPQPDDEETEERGKRWPSVLLCIGCVLALLVALAFLAYCVSDYMGWNFFNF